MKPKLLIIGLLFVLGIGIAFYVYVYMVNADTSDVSSQQTDVRISATSIVQSYEADEQSANTLYMNKIVEVTGRIKEISRTNEGIQSVILGDDTSIFGVSCSFTNALDNNLLTKGDQVTLKGKCTGYLMDVILTQCAIQTN